MSEYPIGWRFWIVLKDDVVNFRFLFLRLSIFLHLLLPVGQVLRRLYLSSERFNQKRGEKSIVHSVTDHITRVRPSISCVFYGLSTPITVYRAAASAQQSAILSERRHWRCLPYLPQEKSQTPLMMTPRARVKVVCVLQARDPGGRNHFHSCVTLAVVLCKRPA